MIATPDTRAANPVLAEVLRDPEVESHHRGAVVVVDHTGTVHAAWGDGSVPVFPRSAVKPLQAIALVESGAADAFDVTDMELALACASHNGEPRHVEAVGAWLERIGCSPDDLECGSHWPLDETAAMDMVAEGEEPTAVHNNCSGKHTGFLTLARHMGCDLTGYVKPGHPVQRRITAILSEMYGVDLGTAPGTDGCSIPTWGVSLDNLARAMARLARPDGLDPARADAVRRITRAMSTHPFMVAGTDRFCTRVMESLPGRAVIKTGAEGVYAGFLPEFGLGIALKCDDGAKRASQVMMAAVLQRFLGGFDESDQLADLLTPPLTNANDRQIGTIRPAGPLASVGE